MISGDEGRILKFYASIGRITSIYKTILAIAAINKFNIFQYSGLLHTKFCMTYSSRHWIGFRREGIQGVFVCYSQKYNKNKKK